VTSLIVVEIKKAPTGAIIIAFGGYLGHGGHMLQDQITNSISDIHFNLKNIQRYKYCG